MEQERDMDFKEKAARFLRANGFFVVAGLCVICLSIALAVSYRPKQAEEAPIDDAPAATQAAEMPEPGDVSIADEPAEAIAPAVTQAPSAAPEKTPEARAVTASKAPSPIEGKVIWGYAVDTLIYSQTLEQWTTHDGIDISAKQGTAVKAIMPGTVKRVYEDDLLGVAVVIEHEGGLVSMYANLTEKPPVKEGQDVKTGDTIGAVGTTAVSECALDSHLHFSVSKDGKSVDPTKYVLIGG